MMKNSAIFTLAGVALLPLLCSAQELDRNNEISVRLGGYGSNSSVKIDNKDDAGKSGSVVGFRYIHNASARIGVGVEMNALKLGESESTVLVTNGISKTKVDTFDVLGVVRIRFGRERFRPYALGGLGIHSTKLRIETQPQAGLVWANTGTRETRTLIDSRKAGIAVALESGFDYHFNNTLSAGAFLGWHFQSRATYDATAAGRATGLTGMKGSFAGVMLGGSLSARF